MIRKTRRQVIETLNRLWRRKAPYSSFGEFLQLIFFPYTWDKLYFLSNEEFQNRLDEVNKLYSNAPDEEKGVTQVKMTRHCVISKFESIWRRKAGSQKIGQFLTNLFHLAGKTGFKSLTQFSDSQFITLLTQAKKLKKIQPQEPIATPNPYYRKKGGF